MMDPTVLFITISLMFIMSLLLIGTIHSRLHWITKAFFIVFSLVVVTMDYKALTDSLGWPVIDSLPNSFQLLGADIEEPAHGDDGAIYVWYRTYEEGSRPRSVQIPYNKENHKQMAKAQAMLADGQQVHMSRLKAGEGPQGPSRESKDGKPGDKRMGQSNFQSPGPLDFVPPPDAMPLKDLPASP